MSLQLYRSKTGLTTDKFNFARQRKKRGIQLQKSTVVKNLNYSDMHLILWLGEICVDLYLNPKFHLKITSQNIFASDIVGACKQHNDD